MLFRVNNVYWWTDIDGICPAYKPTKNPISNGTRVIYRPLSGRNIIISSARTLSFSTTSNRYIKGAPDSIALAFNRIYARAWPKVTRWLLSVLCLHYDAPGTFGNTIVLKLFRDIADSAWELCASFLEVQSKHGKKRSVNLIRREISQIRLAPKCISDYSLCNKLIFYLL